MTPLATVSADHAAQPEAGGDYNLMPYPSMPFADTQPAVLAAVATMFGLSAPDASCARVLELGCASGGNIIPLALRFPNATFMGIDLGRRHIEAGNERVAALGLPNVRLIQADIATIDLTGQEYDFIICNGVFSWVPALVQQAILRICQQTLAPDGVASISYNVLPGWHLRMVIRDICLRYAGAESAPHVRVAKARAALERLAEASDEAGPYGQLLKTEARRLKGVPSSYILGEFLAPDNRPCTLQDFTAHAASFGLDFLSEPDFFAAMPRVLDGPFTAGSETGRRDLEHHIDYVTGRLFRRSVLVRQRVDRIGMPGLDHKHLGGLHVSAALRADPANSAAGIIAFVDEQGRTIAVRDTVVGNLLKLIGDRFPGTVPFRELLAAADLPLHGSVEGERRIGEAIFKMVLAGRLRVSAVPLSPGSAIEERPLAWPLARLEAMAGQPWITTLQHVGVPMSRPLKAILPYLDGRHDRPALRGVLKRAITAGDCELPAWLQGVSASGCGDLDTQVAQFLEELLRYLERSAVLAPDWEKVAVHPGGF